MKGILIIRKYKNRRLYDTERSSHITREELIHTIRSGRTVQIQEANTGEDVTVETLFSLFVDETGASINGLIPAEFVHFLIRAGEQGLSRFFREFLPRAMEAFGAGIQGSREQQQRLTQMMGYGAFPNPWLYPWGQVAAPASPDDVDQLKTRLEEMEAELVKLRKRR